MLNRFHPVYHSYTYLAGSRVDLDRGLDPGLVDEDAEDVVDQLSEPPQFMERPSPVSVNVGGVTVKGRNWTDMMIKCYREFGRIFMRATAFLRQSLENNYRERTLVPFMSMAVDPDALVRLIEYDYEAGETSYAKLIDLYEGGAVAPCITTPFHAILPLLPTTFDRRLCIRLGMLFHAPLLRAYERYLKSVDENQMVVGFWAPDAEVNHEVILLAQEEFHALCEREKFKKPHLVVLADADMVEGESLDHIMKSWCRPRIGGKPLKDVTVVLRDTVFSYWMMHSHPSIKKIIDRTIAKVDNSLTEREVDYGWAHFESLEALTHTPRDAQNYEQRILKLCELGYLSVSPDTYVRRKLNGRFGVDKGEPLVVNLRDPKPATDPLGETNVYGHWRGWALGPDKKPHVMPDEPFVRVTPRGSENRQGSPCWKIAWEKTVEASFRVVGGDSAKMTSGVLGLLAKTSTVRGAEASGKAVEAFLTEYGLIYWREHFIQHNMSEADIRLDEILARTLFKGSKKKPSTSQMAVAALAAQAYYFLLDSRNSYALDAESLDQRAMFQSAVMLTLAHCNAVAAFHYAGDEKKAAPIVASLRENLLDFQSAFERFGLEAYGVTRAVWTTALKSDVTESKANVVERAARRTAARHLAPFGYEELFGADDEELTTNVGHNWNAEVSIPNYEWANPYFCGVREV
jgi:hypothetical protein